MQHPVSPQYWARFMLILLLLETHLLASAAANNIQVVGLFKDAAVVVINGRQRVMKAGEHSGEGIILVSANSQEALFEIAGQRVRLGLGTRIQNTYAAPAEKPTVRIWAASNGMFTTAGRIDGAPVNFLVDTGASHVAMNKRHAKRLGIDYRRSTKQHWVTTASGVAQSYRVTLDRVKVGDIELTNVSGIVLDGDFPRHVLLGMSFLNRLEMQRDGNVLELRQRY